MSPNELFDNNQRLVGLAIKQLGLRPQGIMGMDDYFQVGYVGLWRAAQSFDPDRGFAFSTFAVAWIKGVLMKERRDHGCNAVRLPRSAFERGDRVHVVDLDELYSAPAASVPEDSESRMDIENAMQSLTAKEREALEYRLQGGVQCDIGQAMGISQGQVSRILSTGCKKLKAACRISEEWRKPVIELQPTQKPEEARPRQRGKRRMQITKPQLEAQTICLYDKETMDDERIVDEPVRDKPGSYYWQMSDEKWNAMAAAQAAERSETDVSLSLLRSAI